MSDEAAHLREARKPERERERQREDKGTGREKERGHIRLEGEKKEKN